MKVRIRFSKNGPIRFISHRDVARVFERAFRSAAYAISYSEGFSPRPKISFGLALSVGFESDAEYLDVDLAVPIDLEALPGRLTDALPDGLVVHDAVGLEPGISSLQQAITSCEWQIEVLDLDGSATAHAVDSVLAARSIEIERERKGRRSTVDVRPAILRLGVASAGPTVDGVGLDANLATDEVTIRPDELVPLLSPDARLGRVRRLRQWTMIDGQQTEPLAAAVAWHRLRCAS